jgi:hypothetical protein
LSVTLEPTMKEMSDFTFEKVFNVYGGDTGLDGIVNELNYIPCIPKQLTGKNKHLVDKECIADLKDPKALEKKF